MDPLEGKNRQVTRECVPEERINGKKALCFRAVSSLPVTVELKAC